MSDQFQYGDAKWTPVRIARLRRKSSNTRNFKKKVMIIGVAIQQTFKFKDIYYNSIKLV